MQGKIKMQQSQKKHPEIDALVKDIIEDNIPDDAIVFLNPSALTEVFTKKRLELIKLIDEFRPASVLELASIAKRTKQAVSRDLKLLEGHRIIKFNKVGKTAVPIIMKRAIYFPLKGRRNADYSSVGRSKQKMTIADANL